MGVMIASLSEDRISTEAFMLMQGSSRNVFCELELIANGTLVHYSIGTERKKSTQRPDMRPEVGPVVRGYQPSPWTTEAKTVYCKTIEDVLVAVKEAQAEQIKIAGLRSDGLLDSSRWGG
jgi:hypothetical protein